MHTHLQKYSNTQTHTYWHKIKKTIKKIQTEKITHTQIHTHQLSTNHIQTNKYNVNDYKHYKAQRYTHQITKY